MSFISMRIKNQFHINSFVLSPVLKQRLKANRKWSCVGYSPINNFVGEFFFPFSGIYKLKALLIFVLEANRIFFE